TACAGRWVAHRATSAATLRPAARMLARMTPGWRAITSSAEPPIDPVAPSTATRCISGYPGPSGAVARRGCVRLPRPCSEPEPELRDRERRQRGQHAVDPVQHAAVPRDQGPGVLGPDVALEQALEQVADHREQH